MSNNSVFCDRIGTFGSKNTRIMVKHDRITFGNYNWRVLDPQPGRSLIITDEIIELRWYHREFADITWADCALREYLNQEFYDSFAPNEKTRIIPATNGNPDNPWFRTKGGADTVDRIFLLSLEEVCTYFGDSKAPLQHKGSQKWLIDDENNVNRQAKYGNDLHWWRQATFTCAATAFTAGRGTAEAFVRHCG
jgi:hypothetical protein